MQIDKLIESLSALKELHGNIDVTVWQYGGGLDDLCSVLPKYDEELDVILLDTEIHESGERR